MRKKEKKAQAPSPISVLSPHRMELSFEKKGKRVLVEGVKRITVCHEDRVELLTAEERMVFEGRALHTVAYTGGAMEIVGDIREIAFSSGEAEG